MHRKSMFVPFLPSRPTPVSFLANGKFSWHAWPVRLDKPLYSSGSRTWYEYLARTHDATRLAIKGTKNVLKIHDRSNSKIFISHVINLLNILCFNFFFQYDFANLFTKMFLFVLFAMQ